MDPDKRERLRKNHKTLKKDLDTNEILDSLYSEGIFNDEHCEVVRAKSTVSDRNQELLTILKTTGNIGYDKFCEILSEVQPHLLTVLQKTKMDQEITGKPSDGNIFFEPSDDFELKGLIDQLTLHDRITEEQLTRMKNIVQSENGCPADVIRILESPARFFGHLMDKKIVTRYNLAFLQSLLWRVGLRQMCEDVARFARVSDDAPIHFFLADSSIPDNGYVLCKFHVRGKVDNFKGITIEKICIIVSRYLGVPRSQVVPVGLQPVSSILLTVMVPEHALHLLMDLGDCPWLAELGVDCITSGTSTVDVKVTSNTSAQSDSTPDARGQLAILESELDRKVRAEQQLMQCLYDEQMTNETLRDMYDRKENEVNKCKEDLDVQMRGNTRLFYALMVTLNVVHMLLQRLVPHVGGSTWDIRERSAQTHFKYVVEKAKRVCRSDVLYEVIDAHALLKEISNVRLLDAFRKSFSVAVQCLQANVNECLMYRMVGRSLGVDTVCPPVTPPQQTLQLKVDVAPVFTLEPDLEGILLDLGQKLTKKQAEKLFDHHKVAPELRSDDMKRSIFVRLVFAEYNKNMSLTDQDVERVVHDAVGVCGRGELWSDFVSRNKKRTRRLEERLRHTTDVPERLDNIEKVLKKLVAQNASGLSGFPLYNLGEAIKMPVFHSKDDAPYYR
ncbi:uncharacterized protein [Haliotis asinina]|uniref:uncharacterized protein n=1 Tax=Haliotis asinina TaxID=109174 RepID=UPI003531CFDB